MSCIVNLANVAIDPDRSHRTTISGFDTRGCLNCGSRSTPPWPSDLRIVRLTSSLPDLPCLRLCDNLVESFLASGAMAFSTSAISARVACMRSMSSTSGSRRDAATCWAPRSSTSLAVTSRSSSSLTSWSMRSASSWPSRRSTSLIDSGTVMAASSLASRASESILLSTLYV